MSDLKLGQCEHIIDNDEPCQQCEAYQQEYSESLKGITKHHVEICPCGICTEARRNPNERRYRVSSI